MLDFYLKALDMCYFEVGEAFKGLSDENVWKRPNPALLSVGELAGHIAYWEAVRYGGENSDGSAERDLSNCKIKSPLLDPRFGYYPGEAPTNEQLALTAEQVHAELVRIHEESMSYLKALNPDPSTKAPHWGSTYADLLNYAAFHVAYHTGQMYSVRYLLGETPPDN
ncbi:MAG TPA: DinB family protein [Fimbriimonadaceae bacterium]|jgi:hypothetical protein